MKRCWFVLGLFLLFVFPLRIFAFEFLKLPEAEGFVNDFAELLSPAFRQKLEADLQNFEKETSAEIVVVTINSLEDNSIEDYAVRLFEDWKIGKKGKDNGLLILIAKKERKIRIEVGYGLEPIITDGRAGRIIREQMKPAFRNNDYEVGVLAAVVQIEDYIRSGQPPTGIEKAQEEVRGILPLLIFAFFIFIYFASFLGRTKEFWPGGIIGGILGAVLGIIAGTILAFFLLVIGIGFFGLLLDYVLSRNYKKLKAAKKSTGFWSSWGGFSSGGRSFGGFGGGSSGGGGASGSW